MHLKSMTLATCFSVIGTSAFAQQKPFLLVSSRNTNSVRMYDAQTGAYIRDWAPPGLGGLDRTQEVIYGPDGNVYVSGIGTSYVLRFDGASGQYMGSFTTGYQLDSPTKISWGPDGLMYVSQWGQQRGQRDVARFDPGTGAFVDEFTTDKPFGGCDQEWDANGNMYLASFASKTVIKYAPDGSRIGFFTDFVPAQGPVDLYWADNGDLMVVDWDHGRVNAYDPETGAFKRTFIEGMTNTEGITIGPDGRIYAADWTENTINVYSAETGAFEGVFIGKDGGLKSPNALIFGPRDVSSSTRLEIPAPSHFRAEPNYPNPFASNTTIPFTLDHGGTVLFQVFDLQGRLKFTARKTAAPLGRNEFQLDGSRLSAGRYIYQIRTAESIYEGLIVKE